MNRSITRYIPEDSISISNENGTAIVYTYTSKKDGKPAAIAYLGKSGKAYWHYRFMNTDQRAQRIAELFESVKAQDDFKAARKIERDTFQHNYKAGDILYSSWGYDQTNIDFYQVVSTTAKTITVREICGTRKETGFMCGETTPIPNQFYKDELITRKVCANDHGGYIKIESFEHAWKWDGEAKHYSTYA